MTNGGLETTRSKRCPATGSSRSPLTSVTRPPGPYRASYGSASGAHCGSVPDRPRVSALSSRLKAVNSSARSERSVAVTWSAWASRCRVWTPQPVPRSRARATGRRMTLPASVKEARPIPTTCQDGSVERVCRAVWSLATHRSPWSSVAYGERSTTGWRCPARIQPRFRKAAPAEPRVGRASSRSATGTGSPSIQQDTAAASARWEAVAPSSPITWATRRRAGSACSRSRAAVAGDPSRAPTPSAV